MPTPEDIDAQLRKLGAPPTTITEKFILGSGAGGQKINKSASCVYLKHHPTGIEVKCQGDRSRDTNRQLARRELIRKLESLYRQAADEKKDAREKNRRTNRPRSRNSKNRMLKAKRNNSNKKKLRKRPGMED
ncbi:peptide chain release factor family protein [Rubritalea marina]|uniref:peptide chain release factor family protein n=1 Tax=Rubritalea marina TaxID=361055 RepID=UPI00037F9193|nr:peptide chain release factor-like protein [Rubritalea marina]